VLNIEQLLQTGVLQGPYKRTKPVTRRTVALRKAREFCEVYALYAKHHSPAYAFRRAWHIVIQGADF